MEDPVTQPETGSHYLQPDRNLAMELVRATEAAAIRAAPFIGRGDKNAADGAAVDAMRAFLGTVNFDGVVVIGEGEKDEAPMLFNGEHVGNGRGPSCDIAVDPIDGTSLTAAGRQNALSVIAVSDRGSMFDPSAVFYMDKIVTGADGIGVVDISQSIGDNIRELAKAKGKQPEDIRVAVLDRPRHAQLIEEIRAAGAGTRLLLDGDVAGGINAARYDSRIDMCVGIGGTPEGIITACAVKALGGLIQGKLMPKDDAERERALAAGHDLDRVLGANDLVRGDNTYFVATGVTHGELVDGVQRKGPIIRTESLVLRSRSGTIRRVEADHLAAKWL
ncbi:class II fructose-bisphosphatase [Plantibacter sp. VKM Ac-2885]|jgi:fructose-1,6-bisphosphatase II|uniref:Fructose-1,6-bisphosphatase n=4 Tax=Plantibacter TaxID=190323 RepID=A0A3N2C1A8_9MICO|nr:class II fructose-bisphosphatase [Plantibacter sp. PA-3-X8]MBD8102389.1 class II fructose-bisphosphatase [Plantibacter sp. CFBP 8775]MBD8466905.1 class II fructose-bisphosphatase [Plantibacter sp. CFBP 8798]MBD8516102.1 class II fructose-bisphosphatase [Plantibacter sp. CFBP 8804]MBD8535713.1 class II fructose-bisphosphatase [Plantibacter sp. CFBP 13570]MBF4512481.1 class II fructose-bisphosphatase [Plantibacter sp. VKM Ac-2885]MBF4565518.1 class II fructose-bisphosphatase [Plantibacter sp